MCLVDARLQQQKRREIDEMRKDYTQWPKPESDKEIRDGKEVSYERWLGKEAAKKEIAKYNETWGDHHGKEVTTHQSFRRFANELSYAKVDIYS